MRLTERRGSGGKRKWRQIRQKISKEKSVKKRSPQKKKGDSRKRETGQTTVWKVWFYISGRTCPVGDIKSFFQVCLPWVTACSIHGAGGHARLSASGSNGQRKRKTVRNP